MNVDAELPENSVTGLYGPSASGKTSLLRAIAGFLTFQGYVRYNGETWFDSATEMFVQPHRRLVGYVHQSPRLFRHLTVRRNLELPYKLNRKHAQIMEFERVVDLLDLGDLLKRSPKMLSGGETQRVAIGQALVRQPKILLLDEPLSGLDIDKKHEILPYLDSVRTQANIPVIYVSHDVDEIARFCDNVMMLDRGHAELHHDVHDVFSHQDLRTLTGRLEESTVLETAFEANDADDLLAQLRVGELRFSVPFIRDARVGQKFRLRIRSRDVSIATDQPTNISIRNVLKGRIARIEHIDESPFTEVDTSCADHNIRARITRAACRQLKLEIGQEVYLLIKTVSFDQ